jgi:hypothetical protein
MAAGLPKGFSVFGIVCFFPGGFEMSNPIFFHRSPKTLIVLLLVGLLGLASSAGAAQKVTISWSQPSSGDPVSGYRLYQNNLLLCETLDPAARTITCPAVLEGNSVFTVVAVYGDGGEVVPPVNAQPAAQNLAVTLDEDGTIASFLSASDPENDPLNYVILTGPTSGVLVLTDPLAGEYHYTPNKDVSGTDAFTFLANDGSVDSAPATVSITIKPVNDPPAADAGADQSIPEGQNTVLNAAGSIDIDDGIVSYSWTQLSGPTAVLSDSGAVQPTVITPDVGVGGALLTYELTVSDLGGLQARDTVSISVLWLNKAPAADAGADQSISAGATVTLDGSGSADIDDGIASYSWTQLSGPSAVLSDNNVMQPTVMTPDVGVGGAVLTYELTVTDQAGLQSQDTVAINVMWLNIAPTADAGADQSISAGATITLDGSGSYDTDDGIASVLWVQTVGTPVTLSGPTTMQPSFSVPADMIDALNLTFELTVRDLAGLQHTDSCVVNVIPQETIPANNITLSWSAPASEEPVVSFEVSLNGAFLCETLDPTAREITCPVTLAAGENEFAVTAIYASATETATAPAESLPGDETTGTSDPVVTEPDSTEPVATEPDSTTTSPETDPVVIVNQVPTVSAIVTSVEEDGTVNGTLAGIDADGDALTYTIQSAPAGGQVELLSMTTGEFRYTPGTDVTGQDSFLYSVSDGKDVSTSAVVTINILPANDPPIANAGPDQVVNKGEAVVLDATNSYDIDDELLTVLWTQLDGPTVTLSDPAAIQPRFAAIDIGMDSVTLIFQLTVTDAQGLEATDISSVNVVWVNEPPVAIAGEDQKALEGDLVVLDASGSTDSDDGIAAYAWLQLSGPEMKLSDSKARQPSFSAPDVDPAGASMTFEVTVTDFGGLYTKDTVIINVSWVNTPPVADAGIDQSVSAGDIVTLDGSLSYDEDDGIAMIQWSQKTGMPVTLSDPIALLPEFETPADITASVTLVFELIITDHSGLQHTDSCIVEVLPVQPSIAGDLDGDGDLDAQDKEILQSALYTCVGEPGYLASADLNGDTCVTRADARIWNRYFRKF